MNVTVMVLSRATGAEGAAQARVEAERARVARMVEVYMSGACWGMLDGGCVVGMDMIVFVVVVLFDSE